MLAFWKKKEIIVTSLDSDKNLTTLKRTAFKIKIDLYYVGRSNY